MERLRRAANVLDRPVSELVREATEEWLRRHAPSDRYQGIGTLPVFSAGNIRVAPEQLRKESSRREEH